jgi:hypothetical protein
MSNVLEKLKDRRRQETELQTGLKVGWHAPDIEECVLKLGQIPLPAVAAMKEQPTEEEAKRFVAENPAEVERGRLYVRLIVAAMLDDIDGDPIDPQDDRDAIVATLEPIERQELFLLGSRQKDPNSGEA